MPHNLLEQIQSKECKSAIEPLCSIFLIQLEFHIKYTEEEDLDMKEAVVPNVFLSVFLQINCLFWYLSCSCCLASTLSSWRYCCYAVIPYHHRISYHRNTIVIHAQYVLYWTTSYQTTSYSFLTACRSHDKRSLEHLTFDYSIYGKSFYFFV